MNRSFFQWRTICRVVLQSMPHRSLTAILAILTVSGIASFTMGQVNGPGVTYRVESVPAPINATSRAGLSAFEIFTDASGVANFAIGVGAYSRPDWTEYCPLIYDHFGTIDPLQPRHSYSIDDPTLGVQFPPTWLPDAIGGSFRDINSSGRIVGYLLDSNDDRFACYLDLFPVDASGDSIPRELKQASAPLDPDMDFIAQDVNEFGDILVGVWPTLIDGSIESRIAYPYIYNPDTGEYIEVPILTYIGVVKFNQSRQVFGRRFDNVIYRHSVEAPDGSGTTELFPDFSNIETNLNLGSNAAINDAGQCSASETLTISKGKNRGNYYFPTRIGAAGNIEWQRESTGRALELNQSGDLLVGAPVLGGNGPYSFYHEGLGQELLIMDLVSDPESKVKNQNHYLEEMTDRDQTGFPWFTVLVEDVENSIVTDRKTYLLIPELDTPTPGISVTPIDGLVTTEAGGWDSFDVVLNTEPSANVTIDISSDSPLEGTTDVTYLTFTSTNWATPQTVTVTGLDDFLEDGDANYWIETAAATSTDTEYRGLNADDVQVTNEDDEVPTGGGFETYPSGNLDLEIPDKDATGISSSIMINDDFPIASLTVNLNITHQRPSDLNVYLVGPNGEMVQLSEFAGDNPFNNFNGSLSAGLWTLEMVDSRKKRIGTLHDWSITIEFE